jgi:thymidine kinase
MSLTDIASTDSSNIVYEKPKQTKRGYLELIIGPMFSGKTKYLVNLYNNYGFGSNNTVVAINYIGDKRYHDSMISTHDNLTIPCIFAENLNDILLDQSVQSANIILINEGQFFPDLVETVMLLVEKYEKIVHICGLDGDFKRQKFGALLDLVPFCNKITKLLANCSLCKSPALFSHRVTNETTQIIIGGSSDYMPLCRNCYITENNTQYA